MGSGMIVIIFIVDDIVYALSLAHPSETWKTSAYHIIYKFHFASIQLLPFVSPLSVQPLPLDC